MTKHSSTRRRFIIGSALGVSALALTGCDTLEQKLTMKAQRLLQGRGALAREFSETDISPSFRVNGSSMPDSEEYAALLENNFADWRLKIDGLVVRPCEFSLADLKRLPARTQITRHDCVEGVTATMRQTHVAGEKLFVDFAGDATPVGIVGIPGRLQSESTAAFGRNQWPQWPEFALRATRLAYARSYCG
jgi:DMSO/TMAO reductase YedYZ molybdopterin-dependent catalytic subunit